MSSIVLTIFLIILFIVGSSVMLYPLVSNYINTKHQSYAIAEYDEKINDMMDTTYAEFMQKAEDYNARLKEIESPLVNFDQLSDYYSVLDVSGTGIIGYITIPQIQIQLPIYHGTSDEVLNIAVGHIEGSTLPIGGENTHAVLSAHRGLPSAKLFSDLDELVVGDTFTVTVLNEILTYQVDKISIVKPEKIENLDIVDGSDYVTLLTCTPYGVNTHRLLVRGKRIKTQETEVMIRVSADAVQIEPVVVAVVIAFPLLILTFLITIVMTSIHNIHKKEDKAGDQDEIP